ncbi:ankyrin repeat domain-containing protein [Empedobacter falsenii]|uniref:ankyrin repeat domain-containing protein n=1 Tax=Empedobacter falsenii TaxID=343874 RepID=UPI00257922B7|nr:ankyrin repeat domain-containing protein [Empedobacter falsenii]MDM1297697.1 ankyrin repeat domain-containing protein [Empedobacter falsenii]MDM1317673.1 ankyrin repeat domain-containing protein [Empedobacter falsenii]
MKSVLILMFMMTTVTACHSTPTEDSNTEIMNEKDIVKAVKNNNLQSVKNLLASGEDVNSVDSSKRSLLLIATNNSNTGIAKLLVKHGADVNQQADNQDSPFLYAGASGQTELVKLFLDHGARFDVFNRYNGSALIPACERGHVETVRLLANTKNYPVDHVNRLGWTGLMEAIVLGDGSKKYQQIVQILKDAGAKMDIPDSDGVTPLQHAQQRGYKEIAAIIKS